MGGMWTVSRSVGRPINKEMITLILASTIPHMLLTRVVDNLISCLNRRYMEL